MEHSMIKLYLLLTASFAAIAAPGCTGDAEDARGIATGADALRALRAGEVVGSIQFGESKTISYGDYFRALTVDARAGDVLQLSVTAANGAGKPMLWINNTSSATTTNLAQNLNAAGARTATLRYAVPAAGRYYLVMRDANLLSQNFSVTLAARPAAACNPDEQECDSVCNPDEQECGNAVNYRVPEDIRPLMELNCGGQPMTPAEANRMIAPGNSERLLTSRARAAYSRKCNPLTGCGAWVEDFPSRAWASGPSGLVLKASAIDVRFKISIDWYNTNRNPSAWENHTAHEFAFDATGAARLLSSSRYAPFMGVGSDSARPFDGMGGVLGDRCAQVWFRNHGLIYPPGALSSGQKDSETVVIQEWSW